MFVHSNHEKLQTRAEPPSVDALGQVRGWSAATLGVAGLKLINPPGSNAIAVGLLGLRARLARLGGYRAAPDVNTQIRVP